jgi:RNA polymerase sigma factor (sigma-70 family)
MHRLIAEYKAGGDQAVRNAIVGYHLRLIARSARRYANEFVTYDDLMAEGAIAVLKAVDNYDNKLGVPFTAYASAVVRFTHRGAAARSRSLVTLSAGERKRRSDIQRARAVNKATSGNTATPYEAFAGAGWTAIDSLNDALASTDQATPAQQAETSEDLRRVLKAVKALPRDARRALTLRYGLFGEKPRSTSQLRSELGVPLWQIRQMLYNAMGAIRAQMTPRDEPHAMQNESDFTGGSPSRRD